MDRTVPVKVERIQKNTILIGHVIGTFDTPTHKGDIVAAGRTVRVHVTVKRTGHSEWFDVDIERVVAAAVDMSEE